MNAPMHVILPDWQEIEPFDEFNDDHVRYVVGREISKEIQALLIMRSRFRGVEKPNKETFTKDVMKDLDDLYEVLSRKWRDEQ